MMKWKSNSELCSSKGRRSHPELVEEVILSLSKDGSDVTVRQAHPDQLVSVRFAFGKPMATEGAKSRQKNQTLATAGVFLL